MAADAPEATPDYSNAPRPARRPRTAPRAALPSAAALRVVLGAMVAAGAVLLVVSTFTAVARIRVLTTSELTDVDTSISGSDLHGVALLLVALFAGLMLVGALRGARPAMVALAAAGLLALGLIVGLDVPELDNTGQVSRFYEDATAGAATGFYLETLGAILLLVAGGAMLTLTPRAAREP